MALTDITNQQQQAANNSAETLQRSKSDATYNGNTIQSEVKSITSFPSPLSPYYHSATFISFVSACLEINPCNRPTANQLLQHPFLCDVSMDELPLRSLTNPAFWLYELENNIKDLHAMFYTIRQRAKLVSQDNIPHNHNNNTCKVCIHTNITCTGEYKLYDQQVQTLASEYGLDIYTVRQIAQASDLLLMQ